MEAVRLLYSDSCHASLPHDDKSDPPCPTKISHCTLSPKLNTDQQVPVLPCDTSGYTLKKLSPYQVTKTSSKDKHHQRGKLTQALKVQTYKKQKEERHLNLQTKHSNSTVLECEYKEMNEMPEYKCRKHDDSKPYRNTLLR